MVMGFSKCRFLRFLFLKYRIEKQTARPNELTLVQVSIQIWKRNSLDSVKTVSPRNLENPKKCNSSWKNLHKKEQYNTIQPTHTNCQNNINSFKATSALSKYSSKGVVFSSFNNAVNRVLNSVFIFDNNR